VRVKIGDNWVPGKVRELDKNTPRSYWVKTNDGRSFRRTRTDIIPSLEQNSESSSAVQPHGLSVPQEQSFSESVPNHTNLNSSASHTNTTDDSGGYVTRSGRVVRKPERLVYDS
jgi:hypothetical protein